MSVSTGNREAAPGRPHRPQPESTQRDALNRLEQETGACVATGGGGSGPPFRCRCRSSSPRERRRYWRRPPSRTRSATPSPPRPASTRASSRAPTPPSAFTRSGSRLGPEPRSSRIANAGAAGTGSSPEWGGHAPPKRRQPAGPRRSCWRCRCRCRCRVRRRATPGLSCWAWAGTSLDATRSDCRCNDGYRPEIPVSQRHARPTVHVRLLLAERVRVQGIVIALVAEGWTCHGSKRTTGPPAPA